MGCGGTQRPAFSNTPTVAPEFEGEAGRAWSGEFRNKDEAAIGLWLVQTAGTYYLVTCTRYVGILEDPTHWIGIIELDPRVELPDLHDWHGGRALATVLLQNCHLRRDEDAARLARTMVKMICEGIAPITSNQWYGIIQRSAEHLLYGCHPEFN